VSLDPKYSMILNIAIAALGVIVASTAGLTTIFGQHETQIIVAAGGITLGVVGAINGMLHGYSPATAGPLAEAVVPKALELLALLSTATLVLVLSSSDASAQTKHRAPLDPLALLHKTLVR
jgi:uncharacterized membrane protein